MSDVRLPLLVAVTLLVAGLAVVPAAATQPSPGSGGGSPASMQPNPDYYPPQNPPQYPPQYPPQQFQQQQQTLAILESEILPQADRTLELTTESYRTGRQDFQQLIDTYRTLLEYRVNYHKRVAMREQAVASLERAVGCAISGGSTDVDARPSGVPEAPPLPPSPARPSP